MNLFKRILPDIVVIILLLSSRRLFFRQWQKGVSFHNMILGGGHWCRWRSERISGTYGERTRWTNSILVVCLLIRWHQLWFYGYLKGEGEKLYHLYLPNYVWYVFVMLLGFLYYCVHSISRSGWLHWGCVVGVFSLIFHHYSCRTHLEICNLLYSTHYSRYGIGLWEGNTCQVVCWQRFCCFAKVSNHVQMSYYFLLSCSLWRLRSEWMLGRRRKCRNFWKQLVCCWWPVFWEFV